MKSSLVFAVLGAAVAKDIAPVRQPTGRIVGGYEVSPQFKYPWVVSLAYKNRHSCGGTLFNANTVISAAHCNIRDTADWTARVHRHNLTKTEESESGKTFKIKSRVSHPGYNSTTFANDISIWKLDTEQGFPTGVVLDLGLLDNLDGLLLRVIGWGTTKEGGTVSPVLLETKVPVYNAKKCKAVYSDLDTTTQFCAGYEEGSKDSCQGDSGGPLFVHAFDKLPVLVGVVSWGEGCARPGYPGVYTRVSSSLKFINEHAWN